MIAKDIKMHRYLRVVTVAAAEDEPQAHSLACALGPDALAMFAEDCLQQLTIDQLRSLMLFFSTNHFEVVDWLSFARSHETLCRVLRYYLATGRILESISVRAQSSLRLRSHGAVVGNWM